MDGDGLVERTAWVKGDDAILAVPTPLSADPNERFTALKLHSTAIFDVFDRIEMKEREYTSKNKTSEIEHYLGFKNFSVLNYGKPIMRLGKDENEDGYFDNAEHNQSRPCIPKRLSYKETDEGRKIYTTRVTLHSYPVKEVRFEYEDTNMPWEAYCGRYKFIAYANFLSQLRDVTPETEINFLRHNINNLMCFEQGFKPEITDKDRQVWPRLTKMAEEYKRTKYWDLIK